MHRKSKLVELVKEFIELELPELCVSMDTYSSMNIITTPTRMDFTLKSRGNKESIATFTIKGDELVGMVLSGESSKAMSLILFALEKAIETN